MQTVLGTKSMSWEQQRLRLFPRKPWLVSIFIMFSAIYLVWRFLVCLHPEEDYISGGHLTILFMNPVTDTTTLIVYS